MKIQDEKSASLIRSVPEISKKLDFIFSFGEEVPRGQGLLLCALAIFSLSILTYLIYRNGGLEITLANFMKDSIPLLLLAWGAGLILAAGKVDISLGGIATLGGVTFSALSHFSPYLGIAGGLFVGWVFGSINGWLVSSRNAPSLLVTWAMGVLTSSIAGVAAYFLFKNGWPGSISSISVPWDMPTKPFYITGNYFAKFLGIAMIIGACLLVFRLGALARVVGANALSAKYAGFRVKRVIFRLYGIVGLSAALAGCLYATVNGAANSTGMVGKEMIAIAIAVLGGTVMSGGYFSAFGIFVALVFWTLLDSLINGESLGLGLQEGRLAVTSVAIIVILTSLILGRRMSGETRTIQVDDISHETRP